jgi:TRAP-type C4-dicarboxylate transport system substrate-binding protein
MKGLRIRILPFPLYAAMYEALGSIPVSIEFAEVYVALQQHTVDAIDSALDAAAAQKMYNVCKRCAMTNHILSVTPFMASKAKLASLPSDLQHIVAEESRALLGFWRPLYAKRIGDVIDLMKKNGVAFNEIPYAPFRRAMDPVYAAYRPKFGADLLDRISRTAGG